MLPDSTARQAFNQLWARIEKQHQVIIIQTLVINNKNIQ